MKNIFLKIIFSIIIGLLGYLFFGGGFIGLIVGIGSLIYFLSKSQSD